MGRPRVLTLWPPQIALLKSPGTNDPSILSPEAKRVLLSTPTSGGKTLLAQLLVTSHLSVHPTSVYYVAPTRSLCREVRIALESRLRFLGREIVDGLPEGDWLDSTLPPRQRVEVMTPERLSYLLRTNSTRVLEEVGMFVFDEVHNLGDEDRGWTLEQDIAYLHFATRGQPHRIVLMSAAIGNQAHFVQWLQEDGNQVTHRASDWRGPRCVHAIFTTNADRSTPTQTKTRSANYPSRISYPLFGRLNVRISQSGRDSSVRIERPVGEYVRMVKTTGDWKRDDEHSTPFYKTLVPLIRHLGTAGPVLIVQSTRLMAGLTAAAIADMETTLDARKVAPLLALVAARFGPEHLLLTVLPKGVAYHHATLPSEIKVALEEAVTRGYIKYLVATTTMTEGVNLPVRSVVIASQGSYSAEGYQQYITGAKLINAIGRAGRATKETEGIVVLALQSEPTREDFQRLNPTSMDLTMTSMLATAKALEDLARFEDQRRKSEDSLFQVAIGSVSDFLSFVWFIASELESSSSQQPASPGIADVLGHTFGWTQLTSTDRDRWMAVADLVLERYIATDTTVRRRWAAAGTSVSSAGKIEGIAHSLADTVRGGLVPDDATGLMELILGGGRLAQILALPEAPKDGAVYNNRGGLHRREIAVPIERVLNDWMCGVELKDLASRYLADVRDIDFRFEQLGDLLNKYFEVFLPWVIGTVVTWTNEFLAEEGSTITFTRSLPACVRWGVGNSAAVELMSRGMPSRILAMRIANRWMEEKPDSDIITWLRHPKAAEWQELFSASHTELRLLLDFCRQQSGGAATELLMRGTASVSVETDIGDLPQSKATLVSVDDTDLSAIGIIVNGMVVGHVSSRDQAEIEAIRSSGLDHTAVFSAAAGNGTLTIDLEDPE